MTCQCSLNVLSQNLSLKDVVFIYQSFMAVTVCIIIHLFYLIKIVVRFTDIGSNDLGSNNPGSNDKGLNDLGSNNKRSFVALFDPMSFYPSSFYTLSRF